MGVNTKEKILSAAEKLFMENDHEDVSVRRICAAAGVSNGSFYHHIGSKENLIKMIYYSSDEMGIKIFLQKSKNKNTLEKIELIADIYTTFVLKYGPKFCKHIIFLKCGQNFNQSFLKKLILYKNHPFSRMVLIFMIKNCHKLYCITQR